MTGFQFLEGGLLAKGDDLFLKLSRLIDRSHWINEVQDIKIPNFHEYKQPVATTIIQLSEEQTCPCFRKICMEGIMQSLLRTII